MRVHIASCLMVVGALVVAMAPSALAQPAAPALPTASADGQVGFQRRPQLSSQDMLTVTQKHVERMAASFASLQGQLEQAKAERDVVKTLCLTDKVSQLDVAVRTARDRQAQMQAAISRGDQEFALHSFTVITVLRERADTVAGEASQCVGEEAAFVGDTQTNVKIDPDIATTQTSYPPTDPTFVIGPPQCTSCTL